MEFKTVSASNGIRNVNVTDQDGNLMARIVIGQTATEINRTEDCSAVDMMRILRKL